ncbi:unnamed protein product [Boreogadus saida]
MMDNEIGAYAVILSSGGEDHKLSPPRYPTIDCPGPAGTTYLHPNPGWLATKASRLFPDLRGRRPYRIMASNSIFDSFGNYGSSLLRGEEEFLCST